MYGAPGALAGADWGRRLRVVSVRLTMARTLSDHLKWLRM